MGLINVRKLTIELERAGVPIEGVSATGRIDFKAEATPEQRTLAEQIKAAHDPTTLLPEEQARKDDFAAVSTPQVQALLTQIASIEEQIQQDNQAIADRMDTLPASLTASQVRALLLDILSSLERANERQEAQYVLWRKALLPLAHLADQESAEQRSE